MTTPSAEPRLSATVMLLRDGPAGLEVFMVKRHHQIDFASGALVFPGGKLATGDRDPSLRALCRDVADLPDDALALRACGIRETFEESGVLLARRGAAFVSGEELALVQPFRPQLDSGALGLAAFLAGQSLTLAADALVPFARWITPAFMPKRFDTHFFLAAAPEGATGLHDGGEAVDSVWIRPDDAIAPGSRWTVIFPTRMNLIKLSRNATVSEALARARAEPLVTVEPWIENGPAGAILRIQPDAGYGDPAEPLESLRG